MSNQRPLYILLLDFCATSLLYLNDDDDDDDDDLPTRKGLLYGIAHY